MDVLQGVLETSPNAVVAVDEAGVVRQADRHVPNVLGYSSSEIEGMVVEDRLLEEDRAHHVEDRAAYMEQPDTRPMGRGWISMESQSKVRPFQLRSA